MVNVFLVCEYLPFSSLVPLVFLATDSCSAPPPLSQLLKFPLSPLFSPPPLRPSPPRNKTFFSCCVISFTLPVLPPLPFVNISPAPRPRWFSPLWLFVQSPAPVFNSDTPQSFFSLSFFFVVSSLRSFDHCNGMIFFPSPVPCRHVLRYNFPNLPLLFCLYVLGNHSCGCVPPDK